MTSGGKPTQKLKTKTQTQLFFSALRLTEVGNPPRPLVQLSNAMQETGNPALAQLGNGDLSSHFRFCMSFLV